MISFWVLTYLVLLVGGLGGVEGKRPELVGSSVWYSPNATLLNTNFDVAVVQMDFDQPLYTNGHSFLCPESDQECPSLDCKPCDWSGQQPTGCEDPTCCGPAQKGNMEQASKWCSEEGPGYETLEIGKISRRFTLLKGETMYVRFFIPEDMYCRSIVLVPRPYYGTVSWSFSTLEAYPEFSTITGWRNGLAGDQKTFAYGQTGALFCPNTTIHPEYNVGTYSGMLYGLTETSFEIEIQVSPQSYPLPEPPSRALCSDVPDEVMEHASTYEPAVCINDGATKTFTFEDTNQATGQVSMVLPVPKGCHTLSFATASEIPTSPSVSHRLYCLPSQTDAPLDLGNTIMLRLASGGQTMVLSTCFEEEVTYMICTLRIIEPEPVHFSFSSVADTIRKNILEIPDASLSYMDGLQAAFGLTFGRPKYPCFDFYTNCFDYTITPSDDTLFLYPPPASGQLDSDETFENLQEFYREVGLQEKKENRLSFAVVFQVGTLSLTVKNISSTSIAITSITNKDGESVVLPGGGFDATPEENKQYSAANYIPHIPLRDIPDLEFPLCDTERYLIYQDVVVDRLVRVGEANTLDEVLSLKYSLDVMNEALLAQSCQTEIASKLEFFTNDVTVYDASECRYPFGSLQYWLDPCCNIFLSFVSCCVPFDYNTTITLYGDNADTDTCSEELCASSYYEDLAFSLNNLEDASLGCTSGIKNPSSSLAVSLYDSIQDQYIVCLDEVGLGELYQGTSCQIDSDCDQLEGKCYLGKCALAPLEQLEEAFLACYINHMTSSAESYLRRNILTETIKGDKNSDEFYQAVKKAATIQDCVAPLDPLAIQHRTRFQSQPLNKACVSTALGLEWPNDVIDEVCPGESCLRSFGCLVNVSTCVYEYCDGFTQNYIEATEESCPIDSDCDIDLEGDCEGFHCVYCPPNGDLPCQQVGTFTTQEECEAAFACELPDGQLDFTLTEEECRNQGTGCTTDCVGNSCESIYNHKGGCFVPSATTESDCEAYSNNNGVESEWFKEELCVLPAVLEQNECEMLPSTIFTTCQEHDIDNCDASTNTQQYLGCYVSNWRTCRDEDECEASGKCTDRDLYSRVVSSDPPVVVNGACISSGEYVGETKPFCGNDILVELNGVGCISNAVNVPEDCAFANPFIFSTWIEPAKTEEECTALEYGRVGCQLYRDPVDVLLWILDPEQCSCQGGVVLDRWEWIPGQWRGGVPRKLEWREANTHSAFAFQESLSLIRMAEWIKDGSQEQFLYPLQSQIICESQSISRPLFILACDCAEQDGAGDCYNFESEQKELQMGLSEVCEGQMTFVKDPSAQVTFSEESVSNGCSFLDFFIVYKNYFSAPYVPPPLSFKWQDQRERGVVINDKDSNVGEILGDGLVLTFSDPSSIETFDVCLRIAQNEKAKYDVPDFGYSTEELESIRPLGVDAVTVEERGSQGTWYCAPFDFKDAPHKDGTIRLFPISRVKNYEDKDDEYTDKTTRVLCYVLGGFYCFVGAICLLGLLLFLDQGLINQKTLLSLPNFCTFSFLILCVFRAVFMFLYPTGTFEFQPLAYFVIFEIPTFILFSVLIFMIYSFKRLVYKKGFFPGNPTPILAIGWPFVWAMWVVVTIVYSEVVLEDSNGSSACKGRVPISYEDEESATRTLSIAYQSVIVAVTLFLTSVFFYYTFLVYRKTKHNAKNKKAAFKRFIILVGGSFNVSFLARTILLIIILGADFSSSIYLFITFFITEVMMMMMLLFQFNIRYLRSFASQNSSLSTSRTKTSRVTSGQNSTRYELDD